LSRKERRYKGLAEVFTSERSFVPFLFGKIINMKEEGISERSKTSCCNFINSNYNINNGGKEV